MTPPWFARWGWLHRPCSWQGVAITLAALAFCLQVLVAVDRNAHSVSDTRYGVFPFIVPTFLLLECVAARTARR